MSSSDMAYATVNTERESIEVHNGEPLGIRLKSNRFRFDDKERVWFQRFRNEGEFLTTLAFLISQDILLHEEVELGPKQIDSLKPFKVVSFAGEGADVEAIIEEIE